MSNWLGHLGSNGTVGSLAAGGFAVDGGHLCFRKVAMRLFMDGSCSHRINMSILLHRGLHVNHELNMTGLHAHLRMTGIELVEPTGEGGAV